MSNLLPDLHVLGATQVFPRWRFERRQLGVGTLPLDAGTTDTADGNGEFVRIDNITDWALSEFRLKYGDSSISKDDIFSYVYGILHHPVFRERFANDLFKDLPRIPFAPDFRAFSEAGMKLEALHCDYESLNGYPLKIETASGFDPGSDSHFSIEKMTWEKGAGKRKLRINDYLTVSGIPDSAHEYVVNGRSPLEWLVERWCLKLHERSGIVNDPNRWFDDPRSVVKLVKQATQVAVESVKLINELPDQFDLGS